MSFREVFISRHGELRSGWRALMFVMLSVGIAFSMQTALSVLRGKIDILGPLIFLISTLLASLVMTRYVNRKPFTAIGLHIQPSMLGDFGNGFAQGLMMMTGVFVIEYSLGYAQLTWRSLELLDLIGKLAYGLALFSLAALAEEVFFRGYLFQTLIQGMTFLPAMFAMALFFAFAHRSNPNATAFGLINVALAAIWLSIAYMKTRSLWLPFGLHLSWNYSQTVVYSFPTSGIDFANFQVGETVQTGPEWITGGAFGPEGGALATLMLILSTWYILKSRALSVPEGIITLDSIEDLVEPPPQPEAEAA